MAFCPKCGSGMRIKGNKYVVFLSCIKYSCKETMSVSEGTKQDKENRKKLK